MKKANQGHLSSFNVLKCARPPRIPRSPTSMLKIMTTWRTLFVIGASLRKSVLVTYNPTPLKAYAKGMPFEGICPAGEILQTIRNFTSSYLVADSGQVFGVRVLFSATYHKTIVQSLTTKANTAWYLKVQPCSGIAVQGVCSNLPGLSTYD